MPTTQQASREAQKLEALMDEQPKTTQKRLQIPDIDFLYQYREDGCSKVLLYGTLVVVTLVMLLSPFLFGFAIEHHVTWTMLILSVLVIMADSISQIEMKLTAHVLMVQLGSGLFRRFINIDDIDRIKVIKNESSFSLGILPFIGGAMWGVGGTECVVITLKNGSCAMLQSDDGKNWDSTLKNW